MSNRLPYETSAIERFIDQLRSSGAGEFYVEDEHVPVGRKNCDFLLAPREGGGRRIAVEIVRVVDDRSEMQVDHFRAVHWSALKSELRALGVDGVLVETPWSIRAVPRETQRRVAPTLACKIRDALNAASGADSVMVDGHRVTRVADLSGIVPSAHSGAHILDRSQLTEVLLSTLEEKDEQLALPDVDRVLLTVAWNTSLDATAVARELAVRSDLARLHHTDRVVFLDRSGVLSTVYSRQVRDFFEVQGPFPSAEAELANTWFETRLSRNLAGTFELVRATAATHEKGIYFLSTEARSALAMHGTQLVEVSRHEDAVWVVRTLRADADPPADSRPASGGICTVRGTTAWLAHRLAAAAPLTDLPPLVHIVEDFAKDPNVYVREMASFGVRALMARRDSMSNGSFQTPATVRADVKRVWRAYVDAAPADGLADDAAATLDFVYDLDEAEVDHVAARLIDNVGLEGMRSLARSLTYFAYVRPAEPAADRPFDGARLRARVTALLGSNERFRGELAFVLFRTMEDSPELQRFLAPLVTELFDVGPDRRSTGFAVECMRVLAVSDALDATAEQKAFACLLRTAGLHWHVRMDLGFRLGEACAALIACGQAARVDRWLQLVRDPELLEFVDRKLLAGPRHSSPEAGVTP